LFGEWGSGKSFFMGRLRQQVAELSTEEGYLPRIEQIGFNAWHYADTNLWASLGDEIFRQLARPRADEQDAQAREMEKARRKQLVKDLGDVLSQERELEVVTKNAQLKTTALRTRLDDAREKQGEAVAVLLRSVAGSDSFRSELQAAWKHLGITDEVEQAQLLTQQIRGVNQDVNTFRRATAGRRGVELAVLVVLSILVLAAGSLASNALRNWLVSGGLVGMAGGLVALTAFIGRVGAGARLLAKVATEAREAKDAEVTKKVEKQVLALTEAEAEAEILTTQLQEVRARAGEIGRQLAEQAPGQRFYGFVADRAASQDYQSKLGLISTIRRDFEKLIDLMRDWREHPEDHGSHQPIDRIVLYIDDLDRCSPDQVVEVLQAVHLLLALDLFVVVVGVDPRWLLHSLEQRYRSNFATAAAPPADQLPQSESSAWDATPLNYLEKIFNIPFVLPGMNPDSFADLISGWSVVPATKPDAPTPTVVSRSIDPNPGTDLDEAEPLVATEQPARQDTELASAEPVGRSAAAGVAAEAPVERGSFVDRIDHGYRLKPRPLSAEEVTHLRALAPLVQTPREAKRVFNLYRTLRCRGNLSPASVFLGDEGTPGEFQAVIVLLGLLTAEPRLVGDLLWSPPDSTTGVAGGICHRSASTSWPELLHGLAPEASPTGGWCNTLGKLGQPESWEQVLPKLTQASALVTLPDLTAFQRWGPLVARFSFILSPLAAGATNVPAAIRLAAPTIPERPAARTRQRG
ncbi:P-loop NTPase fold protein, partial [Jatrophihabitans sp.]|uniref:P-loop NTPase fold protein n=1 Tax=Jatrophihabitans sp. TaxID=1932789 RepID=UPI002EE2FD8B